MVKKQNNNIANNLPINKLVDNFLWLEKMPFTDRSVEHIYQNKAIITAFCIENQ